ncbi:MAG: hypothetical protein WA962_04380 [Ornithinimicrobium sp.]
MRRFLVTTLAVPAVLLASCSSDEDPSVDEAASSASSAPTDDAAAQTDDVAADTAMATQQPDTDASTATAGSGASGEVEGGAEGEAAAATFKQFIVALVNADPEMCSFMIDFQGEGPMKDSKDNLELCEQIVPAQIEGSMPPEAADIVEIMEVRGADVQNDTATIDQDNFSDMFAEGFGDQAFTMRKVDGEWYVDFVDSFADPTGN